VNLLIILKKQVIMTASPIRDFKPGAVEIGDIKVEGNRKTMSVTVKVGGEDHKFTVTYRGSLDKDKLKTDRVFTERVANMASAYVSLKDYYTERKKDRNFSIISTPEETKIKYEIDETKKNRDKTLDQFITNKEEKFKKPKEENQTFVATKFGPIIENLKRINQALPKKTHSEGELSSPGEMTLKEVKSSPQTEAADTADDRSLIHKKKQKKTKPQVDADYERLRKFTDFPPLPQIPVTPKKTGD
jgi:hypothetical protein